MLAKPSSTLAPDSCADISARFTAPAKAAYLQLQLLLQLCAYKRRVPHAAEQAEAGLRSTHCMHSVDACRLGAVPIQSC